MKTAIKLAPISQNHLKATVLEADSGMATLLTLDENRTLAVGAHVSNVPVLNKGDSVIICLVDGEAIILDRLRLPHEKPFIANHDGRLIFEGDRFIGLKVKENTFQMTENGEIVLQAKDILSLAEELNDIKGKLVSIN